MCKLLRKLFGKDKPDPPTPPSPPTPEPETDILAGGAKFGVSFFDIEHAAIPNQMQNDLWWLADCGLTIARCFINFDWFHFRDIDNDHKVTLDSQGNIDTQKLDLLHIFIDKCAQKGLIADVSFISHPLHITDEWVLRGDYDSGTGILGIIKAINEWGYTNVIFDPANEHHEISQAMCTQLATDIKNIAGDKYYYGISVANNASPEQACDQQIRIESCNMVRYHNPRVASFYTDVVDLGNRLLSCAGGRPCYFDEPIKAGWGNIYPTADQWVTYFTHLKNLGIHGILHTEAGFVMHKQSFRSQLRPEEKQAIEKIGKL